MISRTAHPLSEQINWFCHFLLPIHLALDGDEKLPLKDTFKCVVNFESFHRQFVMRLMLNAIAARTKKMRNSHPQSTIAKFIQITAKISDRGAVIRSQQDFDWGY